MKLVRDIPNVFKLVLQKHEPRNAKVDPFQLAV